MVINHRRKTAAFHAARHNPAKLARMLAGGLPATLKSESSSLLHEATRSANRSSMEALLSAGALVDFPSLRAALGHGKDWAAVQDRMWETAWAECYVGNESELLLATADRDTFEKVLSWRPGFFARDVASPVPSLVKSIRAASWHTELIWECLDDVQKSQSSLLGEAFRAALNRGSEEHVLSWFDRWQAYQTDPMPGGSAMAFAWMSQAISRCLPRVVMRLVEAGATLSTLPHGPYANKVLPLSKLLFSKWSPPAPGVTSDLAHVAWQLWRREAHEITFQTATGPLSLSDWLGSAHPAWLSWLEARELRESVKSPSASPRPPRL